MVGAYLMGQALTHACVVSYQELYVDSPEAILVLCLKVIFCIQGC